MCTGTKLVMQVEPSAVVLGETVIISCIVMRPPDTDHEVQIQSNSSVTLVFYQAGHPSNKCHLLSNVTECYTTSCRRSNNFDLVYRYMLKIHRVAAVDITRWWCKLVNSSIRSINIGLGSKLFSSVGVAEQLLKLKFYIAGTFELSSV